MTVSFVSPLKVTLVVPYANDGVGQWQLTESFSYYSNLLKKLIVVPEGFSTDFASVPKGIVTWGLFGGRYARPAVVHDYLTRQRLCKREKADLVFLEAMRLENEIEIHTLKESGEDDDEIASRKAALEGRATAMYAAVALFTKTGLWKKDYDEPDYEPIG